MNIKTQVTIPGDFTFSIFELDDPIIQENFNNRFQVVLETKGKRFFPNLKKRFFEFEKKFYFYTLESNINKGKIIILDEKTYHLKLIYDKSFNECVDEIEEYMRMYNDDENLEKLMLNKFIL